jgi:hypothetical protein
MYNGKNVIICNGTTIYSKDYDPDKDSATVVYYDKTEYLNGSNNIMRAETEKNVFPKRIELRLYLYNCYYLTMNNLDNNYETIIKRYISFLSSYYNDLFKGVVFVNSTLHEYFRQIYESGNNDNELFKGYDLEHNCDRLRTREHHYINIKGVRLMRFEELTALLDEDEDEIMNKSQPEKQ